MNLRVPTAHCDNRLWTTVLKYRYRYRYELQLKELEGRTRQTCTVRMEDRWWY